MYFEYLPEFISRPLIFANRFEEFSKILRRLASRFASAALISVDLALVAAAITSGSVGSIWRFWDSAGLSSFRPSNLQDDDDLFLFI